MLGSCAQYGLNRLDCVATQVLPYLIRRAQENSGMMSGATLERPLLMRELLRRHTPSSLRTPSPPTPPGGLPTVTL